MAYQTIPRKYRPQTFAAVVGQAAIVTTLKNALRFKRLAHAYLFCGSRGTGKTTLARVFAKALNCHQLSSDCEPCNQCPSCQEINSGRSLDVLEIDGASNRGIDDIRQINETIGYAPSSGKYKIYIIDEVHMLTKEAFNALLKTLEEPPANVKFFFATTEAHKVLPTIVSRCQRFDLSRIRPEAITQKLASIAQDLGINCQEEALQMIAHLSEGSLRDSESLLDQIICYAEPPITLEKVMQSTGIVSRSALFTLDNAFAQQNYACAFDLAHDIFSSGKDLSFFLDTLIEHYRTLLQIQLKQNPAFFHPKEREHYATFATVYTEQQCLYILDYLLHWQQQMNRIPFKRISLEMILLHIIRSKHRLTSATLVQRLCELEQKFTSAPLSKTQELPASSHPPKLEAQPQAAISSASTIAGQPPQVEAQVSSPPKLKVQHQAVISSASTIAEQPPQVEAQVSSPPKLEVQPQAVTSSAPKVEELLSAPLRPKTDEYPTLQALLREKLEHAFETSIEPQTMVAAEEPRASVPPVETPQHRYDTLMRFAAVELEAIITKD